MSKILIVGAGISGLTAARILKDSGHDVLVLEKNHYLGGACADYAHDGYFIGMHGPHFLHSNDEKAWKFLSRFTEWVPHQHRVFALTDKGTIPIPFNDVSAEIVGELDEQGVVDLLFKNYSRKMWGMEWDELPDLVRSRVPKRQPGRNSLYFNVRYEGIPKSGYSSMFMRMAEGIRVELGVCRDEWKKWCCKFDRVIYCGNVDEMFDYEFGVLRFRSVNFKMEWEKQLDVDSSILNNCTASGCTRTTDYAKMYGVKREVVPLVSEYPCDAGGMEPYYPMWDIEMYNEYEKMAASRGIDLLGRVARYKYLDMGEATGKAMVI